MNAPLLAFVAGLHRPPYSPKSLHLEVLFSTELALLDVPVRLLPDAPRDLALRGVLDRCLLEHPLLPRDLALRGVLDRCLLEGPLLDKPFLPFRTGLGEMWCLQQHLIDCRCQGRIHICRVG